MKTRTLKLIRSKALPEAGGHTLFFHTEGADRRHPPQFFQPHEVPEFEGVEAWFECEKRGGRWRILRPAQPSKP
jgi:hypothetical protein